MAAAPQGQSIEDQLKTGRWSHGLCGCFDNLGICLIAYFVPCVTFGQTRAHLNNGTGCIAYGCLYTIPFVDCALETIQRGEIRKRRGISGGCCGDCMLVFCCPLCALVQEAQEAQELMTQEMALRGQMPLPGTVIAGQVPGSATVVVTTGTAVPGQPGQYPPPGQAYYVAPQGQAYPPPGQPYQPPPQYTSSAPMEEKGQAMARQ